MPNGLSIAINSGDYHDPEIWMDGVVPDTNDDVYANGMTIGISQSLIAKYFKTIAQSNFVLPAMGVPLMTGNTTPSGVASSQHDSVNAYKVFDRNTTTYLSPGNKITWVKYQFPVVKCIRRYYVHCHASYYIKSWTFEGSNNDSTWNVIHTVSGNTLPVYDSGVFANANSYLYYRLNITDAALKYLYTFEMTESTSIVTINNAGGSFSSSSNGITVNAECFAGTTSCMTWNHTGTSYHNGSGNASNSTQNSGGIVNAGSGTLVHIGDGNNSSFYTSAGIINAGSGIIVSSGNYTGTLSASNNVACGGLNSGTGIFSVIGTAIGSNIGTSINAGGLYASAGTIIFNGTAYAVSKAAGISGAAGSKIIFTGISTQAPGCTCPGIYTLGLLQFSGQIINLGANNAVIAQLFQLIAGTETSWIIQDTNAETILLASNATDLSQPAEANVRKNTQYGIVNQFKGSLEVPPPASVALNVPTDNTIGTAVLTAADFLAELANSSDPLAVRLRNVATVESTGDQLAASSP